MSGSKLTDDELDLATDSESSLESDVKMDIASVYEVYLYEKLTYKLEYRLSMVHRYLSFENKNMVERVLIPK